MVGQQFLNALYNQTYQEVVITGETGAADPGAEHFFLDIDAIENFIKLDFTPRLEDDKGKVVLVYVKDLKVKFCDKTCSIEEFEADEFVSPGDHVCTCSGGIAKTIDCSGGGNEECERCFEGYHLDGETCVANVCSCRYGVAATAEAYNCIYDGREMCESCHIRHSDDHGWAADGTSMIGIEMNSEFDSGQILDEKLPQYTYDTHYIEDGYFFQPDSDDYLTGHRSNDESRLGICGPQCRCDNGDEAIGFECFLGYWDVETHNCHSCDDGFDLTAANMSAYLETPIYPNENMCKF